MSKYRLLLDEKLEHHVLPLLNHVGIKTDAVRLKTDNMIMLLQAKPFDCGRVARALAPTQDKPVIEADKKNVKRLATAVADFLLKSVRDDSFADGYAELAHSYLPEARR